MEFIPELQDKSLYEACIEELYPCNEAYRNSIVNRDFDYLLVDDILFYQRPLKSKKSTISNCPYETRFDGEGNEYPIKCVAKSNPYFQEFRLWQFVLNLRIYERERKTTIENSQLDLFATETKSVVKTQIDVDVTEEFLKSEKDYVDLFNWLNDRASIKQDTLLSLYFKIKKTNKKDETLPCRWNYVEDKEYPCNKTRAAILSKLDKTEKTALSKELEYKIWHLLYSVTTQAEINAVFADSKKENNHGVYSELQKVFSPQTIEKLKGVKFEEKDYGSYSEKALKKLLPLMRLGDYWQEENIDAKTRERIEKILTGEYDEKIRNRVREKTIDLVSIADFKGLPVWLACYVVYDRHSETSDIQKWNQPEDINKWLADFKQHSLRNPIVEQVVTETMRTVRDIWKQVGQIDEIHVELGREMKNPADKRAKMTAQINENENTNLRIKAMLMEFQNHEYEIENVRPYSPSQQDILRIYEEGALQELKPDDKDFEFVAKISKTAQPSQSDILRYKCWLEQKYCSPYTGEMISLSRLFTDDYEIEHIIPQSRYFDDSFSNKVICESEVNKLKSNMLGFEFIKKHHGEIVQLTNGKTVTVFDEERYQDFVSKHYAKNRSKMKKLLMDDIPDGFIERQMNDSRYISKYIKGILSNIVRAKDENGEWEQEAVSKNLISCNGSITDRLKKDWGVNDVWNTIILPRFQRLNELTGTKNFTAFNSEGHEIPSMPFELQKGFNKKRIDHRHHAMDAIVIACTTRSHVNLLNNEAAMSKNRQNYYALSNKLRRVETVLVNGKEQNVFKEFIKPWPTFNADVQHTLQNIIVSFKQNLRVINKTVNYYQHYEDGKKVMVLQDKGESWAIRKPLHKATVFGEVNLMLVKEVSLKEALKEPTRIVDKELKQKVKELMELGKEAKAILKYFTDNKDIWPETANGKVEVYYYTKETKDRYFATRFLSDLVGYFAKTTKQEDAIKKIEAITDKGIQKILKAHLQAKGNDPTLAFSADGVDEMNENIVALNGGKQHKPIYKIRRYEKADKYAIGTTGNNPMKFVEAATGTNLFFAVYEFTNDDGEKKRSFVTVPLNLVIDCQKQYKTEWESKLDIVLKEKEMVNVDADLLFVLSPNDFVYIPSQPDSVDGIKTLDRRRILKVVSFTSYRLYAIPYGVAKPIIDKYEFTQLNKLEFYDIDGIRFSIKEVCVPIKVDRLGNIIEINGRKK